MIRQKDRRKSSLSSSKDPSTYPLYQQKYPIRLPKLVPQEDQKNRTSSSGTRKLEEKKMVATTTSDGLFAKREITENDKEKILKELECLQLEEYLEEEAIIEPFDLPMPPSSTTIRSLKEKSRKNSLSPKNRRKSSISSDNNKGTTNETLDIDPRKRLKKRRSSVSKQQRTTEQDEKDEVQLALTLSRRATIVKTRTGRLQETRKKSAERPNSMKFRPRSPFSAKSKHTTDPIREVSKEFIKTLRQERESMQIHRVKKSVVKEALAVRRPTSRSPPPSPPPDTIDLPSPGEQFADCSIKLMKCVKFIDNVSNGSKSPVSDSEDKRKMYNYSPMKRNSTGKSMWQNFTLGQDRLMSSLSNYNARMSPFRDEDDNLHGKPITYAVAKNLRLLLFGTLSHSFNMLWREQTIQFCKPEHYGLRYYLDGPTELMVVIQAHVLKYLLFLNTENVVSDLAERLSPNEWSQDKALALAICDILWKCGQKKTAVVALPLGSCKFIAESKYKEDKITEKMEIFKFTNSDVAEKFIRRNLKLFKEAGGCISFLYSMLLSRGLSRVYEDFCELGRGLLQSNDECLNYRCQALINLGIYGEAVPNIFNGESEHYDIMKNRHTLEKGLKRRSEMGYLTHEEFTDKKNYMVGSCLKTPFYPIWILKNNNKLCVLFSLKKELLSDWKLERHFDLYHYQGISRHVGSVSLDVRLTIDTVLPCNLPNEEEEEENSSLEETIRTKWEDSFIDWNGAIRF
ncbi:probable ubiquitin carboxyl-terminal hydrolase MINDY-4 [Clytia hemisphaerica]|uniref:Ubiquitin carboxyl-terminal hydrolase MINDY n=1 Tax=Clytia hemisphaerica TaxID=252671 RepID=A0A7M5VDI2_9CNID